MLGKFKIKESILIKNLIKRWYGMITIIDFTYNTVHFAVDWHPERGIVSRCFYN
jgi:hypothetical protein